MKMFALEFNQISYFDLVIIFHETQLSNCFVFLLSDIEHLMYKKIGIVLLRLISKKTNICVHSILFYSLFQ